MTPSGSFSPAKDASPTICRKCKSTNVVYRKWESWCGGFEDYEFQCSDCKYTWWVEGADA